MENDQALNAQEAREALAALGGASADAAARLVTPWWYHVVLGLLVSDLVLAVALAALPVLAAGLFLYGIGLSILVQACKNKTGVWRSGFGGGKSSAWAGALLAVYLVCVAVAVGFGKFGDAVWPVWIAAAVVLVATVVMGRRYDAALRADMRSRL